MRRCPGRNILAVHRSAVAEQIEQHNAGETDAVLGRALDLGLILVVDLAGEQLLIAFELLDAMLQLCRGGAVGGRLLVNRAGAALQGSVGVRRLQFLP